MIAQDTDRLFAEALVFAEKIDNDEHRSGVLVSIGIDLFHANREEKALCILRSIANPQHRSSLYLSFIIWCTYHNRLDDVQYLYTQLKEEQKNGAAAQFGDSDFIEQQIQKIHSSDLVESTFKAPVPISVTFDDPVDELIHNAYLHRNDVNTAKAKLQYAFELLQKHDQISEQRVCLLESLLYAFVEFHDPDSAVKIQERIESSVRNTEFNVIVSFGCQRHEAMKVILAQSYVNENRFDDGLTMANEIENLAWRAMTFSAMATIIEAKRFNKDFDLTDTM